MTRRPVDKAIPLPSRKSRIGATVIEIDPHKLEPPPQRERRLFRLPWQEMCVGDSFHVPTTDYEAVFSAAFYRRIRSGHRYLVRTEDSGVRVWRIR